MTANISPADELASVREQLAALKARDDELCELMARDPEARRGNHWLAEVKEIERRDISRQTLREVYPEAFEAATFVMKYRQVQLFGIDPETGEIMSARKFRAAQKVAE